MAEYSCHETRIFSKSIVVYSVLFFLKGNNDDVILSCCLHYCKDKAKDFMPSEKSTYHSLTLYTCTDGFYHSAPYTDGTVRLQREVVLLTDDRNLRVKALTRNVPVRDIPAFLSWAKVG